jgi:hypothetical protein
MDKVQKSSDFDKERSSGNARSSTYNDLETIKYDIYTKLLHVVLNSYFYLTN